MKILTYWNKLSLVVRILIGLVIGAVLGLACSGPEWEVFALPGTLFVSALKAIAPVLVAVLVASSIARAGKGLGARFRTVIVLYLLATVFASFTAVMASEIFPVSIVLQEGGADGPSGVLKIFENLFLNMVSNPIEATSRANYIGVLFWSVIIGLALKKTESNTAIKVITELSDVMSRVVSWVIQLAPIGVMGLVFSAVSKSGLNIFTIYGRLILLLVGCMMFVTLVVNPILVFLCVRKNPYPLVWQCVRESGLNAFFTRSSAANIPVNMDLCERLKIDRDFYSVSIPLGATINMSGAAITITVMTMSVCHTLGLEVSILSAVFLSLIAAIGACGASGVAGGSLLLIPMACSLFGISNEIATEAVAVGFVIGVIQDSFETALNSSSDVLFTASAELYEGRKALAMAPAETSVSSSASEL